MHYHCTIPALISRSIVALSYLTSLDLLVYLLCCHFIRIPTYIIIIFAISTSVRIGIGTVILMHTRILHTVHCLTLSHTHLLLHCTYYIMDIIIAVNTPFCFIILFHIGYYLLPISYFLSIH